MQEQKTSGVFVRESTGLVKNVSFLDAVALNISNMSIGAALAVVGFTTLALPTMAGVNIAVASVIAFALSIPQIIVYTMMTRRFPRAGGDYVWVSRTFGGFVGNVSTLMGYTLGNLPYFSLISLSVVFAIGSVGLFFGNQGFLGLALPGNIPGADVTSQFILAVVIFSILIAVNIFKPKAGYKLVSSLMLIGLGTNVLAILVLMAAGHQGVVNYMNSLGNANLTYDAISSSYSGPQFSWTNTLLMVPYFAFFTYPWLNAGPGVASELRGKSTLKWNVPVGALAVFFLITASFGAMYYVGGLPFINGAFSNPTLVDDYSFNFWTLSMGVAGNQVLQLMLGLGWILWTMVILAYGVIVFSRYLLAQSFDRFLPSRLSEVSSRFGSPVYAHLIDLGITVVMIAGASFLYGTFYSLYGIIVANMAYFGIVGLAAATYGLRKEKGTAGRALGVFGILQAAVFVYLISQFLIYGSVWGANPLAYGYIASTVAFGIVAYIVSYYYHKRRGVDISLAFKEIPPE
jgi:amino acid transporter